MFWLNLNGFSGLYRPVIALNRSEFPLAVGADPVPTGRRKQGTRFDAAWGCIDRAGTAVKQVAPRTWDWLRRSDRISWVGGIQLTGLR